MAYDADKMQEIYAKNLNMGHYEDYDHPGTVASLALGGNYIFAFDNQATGVVLAPGRTSRKWRETTWITASSDLRLQPDRDVLHGAHLRRRAFYLRGEQNLYCIGRE